MELYETPINATESTSGLLGLVLVTNINHLTNTAGMIKKSNSDPCDENFALFKAPINEDDIPAVYRATREVIATKNLVVDMDWEERRLNGDDLGT